MSTIVVVRKHGVAAIGGDTLSKHGYSKQNARYVFNHSKIVSVGDSYIASVGDASWNLIWEDYAVTLESPPLLTSPLRIFNFARRFHEELKTRYYLNTKERDKDQFETSQFNCLIANSSGIYGLYALRAVDSFTRFYAFGAGRRFALGAMYALYEREASAEVIARVGLEAAAEFDEDTDRPVEVLTIPLDRSAGKTA